MHLTLNNINIYSNSLKRLNENEDIKIKFKSIDSADHPKAIQAILHKLSHIDEFPIIASFLLCCMERAYYNTENIGHYALGEEVYTHFTSPIRRLCDLMVHMVLDILLGDYNNINEINFEELEKLLEEASKQASRMERQADVAEYDGNRLAIIKSMKDYIGYEYDAVICFPSYNLWEGLGGYRADILKYSIVPQENGTFTMYADVKNNGTTTWHYSDNVRLHLWLNDYDAGIRAELAPNKPVEPGGTYTFVLHNLPSALSSYNITAQMLIEGHFYFGEKESLSTEAIKGIIL